MERAARFDSRLRATAAASLGGTDSPLAARRRLNTIHPEVTALSGIGGRRGDGNQAPSRTVEVTSFGQLPATITDELGVFSGSV